MKRQIVTILVVLIAILSLSGMAAAQTGDDGYAKVDHSKERAPKIVHVETFREGDLVFFNLFFVDPNKDAEGFGFRGANGAGWDEETHPFSDPSYGRVSLMGATGRIAYPFNLQCETYPESESYVEAWIYDSAGLISPSVKVYLSCQI